MRQTLLTAACAAMLLTLGASTALAGELTGNGTSLKPLHANSECAFSGLDDADDDGFVHTQSFGRLSQEQRDFFRSIGVTPDNLCNGHMNPMHD